MSRVATDRRGVVAPMTGLVAALLIGFVGLAVDTTRAWMVEARMKSALDAAALVGARRFDANTRDAEIRSIFWANIQQGGRGRNWLGATIADPTILVLTDQATGLPNGRIRVSSRATVPTTLFSVLSRQNIVRDDYAVAQRAGTGLELAISLDQTSSMSRCEDDSRPPCTGSLDTKINRAKAAITTMLDILYGGEDRQFNLFVSLVPFSRSINIGTDQAAIDMLDISAVPPGWTQAQWSGCVEARRDGNDITDVAPTGAGLFRPYAWPSTFRQVGQYYGNNDPRNRCTANNAYPPANPPGDMARYCHGDNDWGHSGNGNGPGASNLANNQMYTSLTGTGTNQSGLPAAQAIGPNALCATSRVQPLSARRSDIQAAVNAVTAPRASGGTVTAVGLQGAWYTLSPNFQNRWRQTNTGLNNIPTLPQSYTAPRNQKVAVILTDGDNNWNDSSVYGNPQGSGCGTSNRGVCSSASGAERLYTAYGRVADWNARFPGNTITASSQSSADAALDGRFTATCNAMKAAGITLYVIGFEVDTSTAAGRAIESLLRDCATDAAKYLAAPTAADLRQAFTRIANELVSLRLVE